jgi:hypothetical protein
LNCRGCNALLCRKFDYVFVRPYKGKGEARVAQGEAVSEVLRLKRG